MTFALVDSAGAQDTPPNLKIAIFGDQDNDQDAEAVLDLIAAEGAQAVIHLGDFDYGDNPDDWDQRITERLGACFPYFACVGNHDDGDWYGSGGYQEKVIARMNCAGIPWEGDIGVQSALTYQGIFILLTAPNIFGEGDGFHDLYIRDQLEASKAIWRISGWHELMEAMQVGGKDDAVGWGVYEESRLGGAIVVTGHEHSYHRTNLLSDMSEQTVASTSNDFAISRGETFAVVSGLGGKDVRDQERCFPTTFPYGCDNTWASIYTSDQDANFGAFFAEFNYLGDPCRAHFYFKDIDGNVPDEFFVTSTLGPCGCPVDMDGDSVIGDAEVQIVFDNWGCQGPCPGDVNGDQSVDNRDFLMVLAHWGECGGGDGPLMPVAAGPKRDPFAIAARLGGPRRGLDRVAKITGLLPKSSPPAVKRRRPKDVAGTVRARPSGPRGTGSFTGGRTGSRSSRPAAPRPGARPRVERGVPLSPPPPPAKDKQSKQ